MTKYAVKTKILQNDEYVEQLEVIRTDKSAAENDVKILKEICGRYAWVEEIN